MLKNAIKATLRSVGYEFRRYHPPELGPLEIFFKSWRALRPPPSFIIDVGANHGAWTRAFLRWFPQSECLMIEPQESLKAFSSDLLAKPNVRWKTAGVSDRAGELLLNIPEHDHSASFVPGKAGPAAPGHKQLLVPVVSLDGVVAGEARMPDWVKIDAEGFDLKALQGASTLLGKTEVIFVECAVCCPTFENTWQSVFRFMEDHGYRLVEITDLNRSPRHGILWLMEAVFVSKNSSVWSAPRQSDYA